MPDVAETNFCQKDRDQIRGKSMVCAINKTWIPLDPRTRLTRKQIATLFLVQDGRCPLCLMKLETKGNVPVEFRDEHMLARWAGGSESIDNRALVCKPCAREKDRQEATQRAKALSVRDRHIGAKKQSRTPMPGGRTSKLKRRMDGRVVDRETGKLVR